MYFLLFTFWLPSSADISFHFAFKIWVGSHLYSPRTVCVHLYLEIYALDVNSLKSSDHKVNVYGVSWEAALQEFTI